MERGGETGRESRGGKTKLVGREDEAEGKVTWNSAEAEENQSEQVKGLKKI